MENNKNSPHWDVILDSIAECVFTVDGQWRITTFNRASEHITGVPRKEAIGKLCCEVFRADICETACALKRTMETGRQIVNQPIYVIPSCIDYIMMPSIRFEIKAQFHQFNEKERIFG